MCADRVKLFYGRLFVDVPGCGRQVRQVATMSDPARAKAAREREEEERIREREALERKQVRARSPYRIVWWSVVERRT